MWVSCIGERQKGSHDQKAFSRFACEANLEANQTQQTVLPSGVLYTVARTFRHLLSLYARNSLITPVKMELKLHSAAITIRDS
eukprot:1156931-Pelagomonas_calceolata.AAC.3